MTSVTQSEQSRSRTTPSPSAANYPGLDEWRQRTIGQHPQWSEHPDFASAIEELNTVPPLVFAGEVDLLRERLASVAAGEAFFLQGGDCAETFGGATADKISGRVQTLLQMAVVLTYGASLPVVKMGRMAGQFSKPRSSNLETRGDQTLPSFRGEMVNGFDFNESSRVHDPNRMLRGYHTSASTLNLIRAFTTGGFADLRRVHAWNMGFAANPAYARYESMAREIDHAVKFMAACGADFDALKTTEFFAGHEALLLDYERALTRIDSRTNLPYGTSAHFLWIGERTRELDGAHVDLLSRLRNPIGVKLGPTTSAADALELAERLDRAAGAHPPFEVALRGAGLFDHRTLWVGCADPADRLAALSAATVAAGEELGDRLVAIHVKDGIKPESNPFAPGAPKFSSSSLDQRHAGQGEVPTVEAMKAATNVKYAVIEYDNAPGDVFEDIENSYRFLIDGGLAA